MKAIIQVCTNANVVVDNKIISEIGKGYMILVGIDKFDTEEIVKKMAMKIFNMRINKDENDKTNLNISQIHGSVLSISQFTLCANLETRRPSFCYAADANLANHLYHVFNEELRKLGLEVKEGIFGADMKVSLTNDGPFTIYLSEKDL